MELSHLLRHTVSLDASDLHLKVGRPPGFRIQGSLRFSDGPDLSMEDMSNFCKEALEREQLEEFERELEVDFALSVSGLGRFRGNIYMQRSSIAMVFRHIPTLVPSLDTLNLPEVIETIALSNRGLVLITGMTGSGKTTTLASMVRHILARKAVRVMTVEDPVEFLHKDGMGMITQREVGCDTQSFHKALRYVLRQDPDVLVIGEIRDAETMRVALTAADTGHLVFSTLHTTDTIQTINRVLSLFPPDQHAEIRYLLSHNLEGIIGLRLVNAKGGMGRLPATEVLLGTSTTREYLQDPAKTAKLRDFMVEGRDIYGTRTYDQALIELCQAELLDVEEALQHATHPDEIKLKLAGIGGIDSFVTPGAS